MLQHELPGAREEVDETDLALGAREAIVLLDANHRHTPAIGVELILHPGQGLLPRKEVLAGGEPLLARDDVRKGHGASAFDGAVRRCGYDYDERRALK